MADFLTDGCEHGRSAYQECDHCELLALRLIVPREEKFLARKRERLANLEKQFTPPLRAKHTRRLR